MVKYQQPLDRTFAALADPTRRAILRQLSNSQTLSVSVLADPIEMSLPGLMKHIACLEEAGLISREKQGRTVYCRLNVAPMKDAVKWLEYYEKFWSTQLDSLANFLESETCPNLKHRASRSSVTSKRAPKKSSKRGRKRNS